MVDDGVISAQYMDLTSLREAIRDAKDKLAAIGGDVYDFTKNTESVAWDSDDFLAKFARIDQNDGWVQHATSVLLQTETAIDTTEQNFRNTVARNADNIMSA